VLTEFNNLFTDIIDHAVKTENAEVLKSDGIAVIMVIICLFF